MTRDCKYDVALSFAGAQREYVDDVAKILESNGVNVFYDEFCQSHLWGKDLSTYFQQVYYSQANYCIMFASQEYVASAWPSFERQHALAKQLEVEGEYILPVRFDDTMIPGLPPTIGYMDARKKSPTTIAYLFLEKIGFARNSD